MMSCDIGSLAESLLGELVRCPDQSNEAKNKIIGAWEIRITTAHGDSCFGQVLTVLRLLEEGHKMGIKDGYNKAIQTHLWEKIVCASVAVIFVLLIAVITIRNEPIRDQNIVVFMRIGLALLAGFFGVAVPGLLQVDAKFKGWSIRGTSGFALAIIVYFFTPTVLPIAPALAPQTAIPSPTTR